MTTVTRQIHFKRKAQQKRAVRGPAPLVVTTQGRVPRVSKLMALAIRFEQLIQNGEVANRSELARLGHVTQPRVTQIMNLLNLAPDIQEEVLYLPPVRMGRDPFGEKHLRPITRITKWPKQQQMWSALMASVGYSTDSQMTHDATLA